jgi:hypothetical protein
MSQGILRQLLSPVPYSCIRPGKMEPNAPLSDFDAAGTDFLGLRVRRGRPGVDDPAGAAGDREGMRTDRGHVFVGPRSRVGERWTDICSKPQ